MGNNKIRRSTWFARTLCAHMLCSVLFGVRVCVLVNGSKNLTHSIETPICVWMLCALAYTTHAWMCLRANTNHPTSEMNGAGLLSDLFTDLFLFFILFLCAFFSLSLNHSTLSYIWSVLFSLWFTVTWQTARCKMKLDTCLAFVSTE